jgi:hypothetical protein
MNQQERAVDCTLVAAFLTLFFFGGMCLLFCAAAGHS